VIDYWTVTCNALNREKSVDWQKINLRLYFCTLNSHAWERERKKIRFKQLLCRSDGQAEEQKQFARDEFGW